MIAFDAIEPSCVSISIDETTLLHLCKTGRLVIYGVDCGYIDPKLTRIVRAKLMMGAREVHVPGLDLTPLTPEGR